jgi:hypothetical protein
MSSSKSSSSQSSSTTNQDNRIANDSGIVVAQGGTFTNQLPEEAVDIFGKILDFSGDAISGAVRLADETIEDAQANSGRVTSGALSTANQALAQQQLGASSLIKDLIPVLTVGAVGVAIFFTFSKGR